MDPQIYYTALNTFDPESETGFSWVDFMAYSDLTHLTELVSLDGNLNRLSFMPDLDSVKDWDHIITDQGMVMFYFNDLNYVLEKVKELQYFNLLAIVKQPNSEKANLTTHFDFVGYDLIDVTGDTSALSNAGGFDATFSPSDLNDYGLITDYDKAKKIQTQLPLDNPNQEHTTCHLYEVWRHKTIGRKTNLIT